MQKVNSMDRLWSLVQFGWKIHELPPKFLRALLTFKIVVFASNYCITLTKSNGHKFTCAGVPYKLWRDENGKVRRNW